MSEPIAIGIDLNIRRIPVLQPQAFGALYKNSPLCHLAAGRKLHKLAPQGFNRVQISFYPRDICPVLIGNPVSRNGRRGKPGKQKHDNDKAGKSCHDLYIGLR